jgi:dienelactone hydrolase
VAGFSWGGISNLFAAARDNRIDALVALDGSMRYFPGLVKQAGDVHPEQMTIPLLYFAEGEITLEDQTRYFSDKSKSDGPNVLNAWTHGDLITVHMLGFVHTEHSSMYQRNEDIWKGFAADHKADYEREDGITGYAWLARYTLQFLDAYPHCRGSLSAVRHPEGVVVPETVPLCCQSLLGPGFLGGGRRRSRKAGRHGLPAALYHARGASPCTAGNHLAGAGLGVIHFRSHDGTTA